LQNCNRVKLQAVPDQPRRAVAYIRVSDEGGRGDDLMSPQIQLASIRDHCQRRGYELVKVLEDIDLTGKFWKRRKMETAIAMLEARAAEVVVVWKISRVCRNRLDWAVAIDRVEGAGGQLESATEPIDGTTSTGRFTRGVLAELAAFESERIGEGWREAHRQRFEAGLPVNGRVPFGWISDRRTVRPDPVRAPVVQELFARYLSGQGLNLLANWLNSTGQPSTTGARWHPSTVKTILDHPMHSGQVRYLGELRPGGFEPIITWQVWEAYLAQRRDNRRRGRKESSDHLMSGLLRCGHCGYSMVASGGATHKGKWYPQYRCDHGTATRAHLFKSVSTGKVEAAVMVWLRGEADGVSVRACSVEPVVTVADTLTVESAITDLDRKLQILTGHLLSGLVPQRAYEATRDDIGRRRAELVAELQTISDRALASVPAATAVDLLAAWDGLEVQARRAILRTMLLHVVVTPRGAGKPLEIYFHPVWVADSDCVVCADS